MLPLDLHVLSLPLAFILSQDQTLHCIYYYIKFLARPVTLSYFLLKEFTLWIFLKYPIHIAMYAACLSILSMNFPVLGLQR